MVFSFLLCFLLLISVLVHLAGFVGKVSGGVANQGRYARASGVRLDEITLEESPASEKIAVLPISGIISGARSEEGGGSMVETLKSALRRAEEDSEVKAVILKIDSPGGEVLASDEMYRAILDFQKRARKPVVASMGNLAASGGYYISAPCRWIVANEMTITGSIGVIMHGYNYRGLMDKLGLRPEVYKSGKFKDMLSPDRAPDQIPPEEREMMQRMINETYGRFKSVVQQGRGWSKSANGSLGRGLSSDWADYADGRVLTGREALEHGFVDQLGNFDDAVAQARKLAGLSHATVIQYQPHYDLADLFHLFGKSDARAIKVDLGMDLPRLQAGQMYFLSPTFVR